MKVRAILTIRFGRVLRWKLLAASLGLVAFAASACGGTAEGGADGRLMVVASFFPLADAARRIGGPCVQVTDLTPPGAEPHDLGLTTDALEAIASADVVVYLGGDFQPALEEGLSEATGVVVDVADGQDVTRPGDPHLWLDPSRYSLMIDRITTGLLAEGPPETCAIQERGAALRDRIALLDAEFTTGLAECEDDVIVTAHDAFGYLAEAYGLRQEAIAGFEPEAGPDARRLAELRDLVVREGVSTIFTEGTVAPDVAETLASEVGARTAVLDTLESGSPDGSYGSAMRRNLATLRSALGCS